MLISPVTDRTPAALPAADLAAAHTLLNCLLREVSGPEHQTAVVDGHLLLRLPRRGVLLRVALRRTSLLGAHRFTGPVTEQADGGWREVTLEQLGEYVHTELSLRSGVGNDEFLAQLAASRDGIAAALALRTHPRHGDDRYLESEQSLVYGHRFHPTPKARAAPRDSWAAYAPEAFAAFPLRYLAVRHELMAAQCATPGADAVLDGLCPVPDGYRLLPVHPWQYELLGGAPRLRQAIGAGDVLDLGERGAPFAATASVRTLHGQGAFLKFSLNVRITNCLRKNARYELAGAVALTRLLDPVLRELTARFPGAAMLREPAYRALALPGDDALLEGFGVIVRDDLDGHLAPDVTPLLAAAVADEYPTSGAHVSRLLAGQGRRAALEWWTAYLRLLLPPVLAAYFDYGVVLEPHLQNVLIGVDGAGLPRQVVFRDLEGTKLLAKQHAEALAGLPADVAGPMVYDARRGWDRVVYCLLVNHTAELLAALADLHPELEPALWGQVRTVLREFADEQGCPPRLRALLAGVPLPAKANLLTRWARRADREAGYVRVPSPLAGPARSAFSGGRPPDHRPVTGAGPRTPGVVAGVIHRPGAPGAVPRGAGAGALTFGAGVSGDH
ncbi:IucA/IucC family protein [Streptantibioticus ferralitis]|uniref:IucA/IucC family protein n=1 Tax=Streptantibioticus ferralitis TaxID=236510 RepID=A0ABT5ZBG4_9ACTN|nr:IucA/IucC family protein [Streptantibioticus ferralitis]MDF2261058.1 IucA/IucC family protein [Streptantibioticus ferralitis]